MDHGMNAEAANVWPFALTRSVNTGFRVVVAPEFLVDEDRYALLHDVTSGDVTEDAVYRREYRGPRSETLWLLYRVVHLKAADVGLDGDYAMSGPRRTPLIEGVVCRTPPESLATQELFAEVHRRCGAEVREFFQADTTTRPVSRSQAFSAPAGGSPMRIVELDAYPAEGSSTTAFDGRHPSRERGLAGRFLAAVLPALGLGTGRHGDRRGAEGRDGRGRVPAHPAPVARNSGRARPAPDWPRRAARAAGLIVLTALVVVVVRKLK